LKHEAGKQSERFLDKLGNTKGKPKSTEAGLTKEKNLPGDLVKKQQHSWMGKGSKQGDGLQTLRASPSTCFEIPGGESSLPP